MDKMGQGSRYLIGLCDNQIRKEMCARVRVSVHIPADRKFMVNSTQKLVLSFSITTLIGFHKLRPEGFSNLLISVTI